MDGYKDVQETRLVSPCMSHEEIDAELLLVCHFISLHTEQWKSNIKSIDPFSIFMASPGTQNNRCTKQYDDPQLLLASLPNLTLSPEVAKAEVCVTSGDFMGALQVWTLP
eukprot:Platyproteum_vivax@DN10695_c0_g1_i1.p2